MTPLYTELLLVPKVMLASPRPAFASAVRSLTDEGGRSASFFDAKHTNFRVHVAPLFDFERELDCRGRFALLPWPNSLRCSAATETER